MRFCPFCGVDSAVSVEMAQLVDNGPPVLVEKCIKGHVLPKSQTSTVSPGINVAATLDAKTKSTPRGATLKPGDVIRSAKARVKELNAEISQLGKLTKERDELVRLIEASKPKASVHTIKRSAS